MIAKRKVMPAVILDRLPLPNLKTYTCGSVLALSACVYFAMQVIKDPGWNHGNNGDVGSTVTISDLNRTNASYSGRSLGQVVSQVFVVMIREPVCVWVSNNNNTNT